MDVYIDEWDVVQGVANMNPWVVTRDRQWQPSQFCCFCKATFDSSQEDGGHNEDCLFARARELAE